MRPNIVRDKAFQLALDVIGVGRELRSLREFDIARQMVKSGTGVGANVEEALNAQSRRDFVAKMSIALKEASETHYWLRLVQSSKHLSLEVHDQLSLAEEVKRLLTSIVRTSRSRCPSSGSLFKHTRAQSNLDLFPIPH